MDIKEIALKICRGMNPYSDLHESEFIYFANKLIESYKAELLNEVGEPVARTIDREWISTGEGTWLGRIESHLPLEELNNLFTSDAAVLKATKPLEDQLAKSNQLWQVAQGRCDGLEEKLTKAEQRVAEACALTYLEDYDLTDIAERIRSGEWRKFLKEV